MKIAYGELIGGLSGDMFAAALIDLGLPLSALQRDLRKIPGLRFELRSRRKLVHSIRARQFTVICAEEAKPRSWKQIRALIRRSPLDREVRNRGIEVFACLAAAEAKIHGVAVDDVHFHELGATDSIVDIMAAVIGLRRLGIDELHFSRLPLGRGTIRSEHGILPAPGPATLELLRGLPVFGIDVQAETVTPTGAALARALGTSHGPHPAMTIERIGYGAGQKDFAERPNLFRLTVGEARRDRAAEEMLLVETNIDDMSPQLYDHVMEQLFRAGARDVFLTPIQMKKNRPATLLSVICAPQQRDTIAQILFRETTTIGLRYQGIRRLVLARDVKTVKTRFGEVKVKVVVQPDGSRRAMPEYDDLKRIATARKLPLRLVHDEVLRSLGRGSHLDA